MDLSRNNLKTFVHLTWTAIGMSIVEVVVVVVA